MGGQQCSFFLRGVGHVYRYLQWKGWTFTVCYEFCLQDLNQDQIFSDDELARFEKAYEERRRQAFDGRVQPGEINVSQQHRFHLITAMFFAAVL